MDVVFYISVAFLVVYFLGAILSLGLYVFGSKSLGYKPIGSECVKAFLFWPTVMKISINR